MLDAPRKASPMVVHELLPHCSMEASIPALSSEVDPRSIRVSPPVTETV